MSDLGHEEIRQLLGAFALDAVDEHESTAVHAHISTCKECEAEVAEHREVAAMLANTGGDAPAHLWDRIEARLEPPHSNASVIELADHPRAGSRTERTSRHRARWLGVAAAVVAVALLAGQLVHLQGRIDQLQGQGAQAQLVRAAETALHAPVASKVTLISSADARVAQIAVLPGGSAFLLNDALPALPSARTYQLWGQEGHTLVSLGLLGSHPTAIAFQLGHGDVISRYAVTDERAGGVVRTQHTPVAFSEHVPV